MFLTMSTIERSPASVEDVTKLVSPVRLEYGAVPLDPWKAHNIEDMYEPYVAASSRHIRDKTVKAVYEGVNEGWVQSIALALELSDLIELSLHDSQMMRIRRNPVATLDNVTDKDDSRVIRAKQGTAAPTELLSILIENPELHSIELAKLSHPLDAKATGVMDEDVYRTLAPWFDMVDTPASYYKKKTLRADIPAVTILQKTPIARRETPNGVLWVVRRKAFLVRGDDETDADDPFLGRKVKNEERYENELFPKIDARLRLGDQIPEEKWLQPLSTSYYVHYDHPSVVMSE